MDKNVGAPCEGDIVIFPRDSEDGKFDVAWRIGRVKQVIMSKDEKIRKVVIEYKNENESVFRTTTRTARQIAILHHEGDLPLVTELNEAAKCANLLFCHNTTLIKACGECKTYHSDQLCCLGDQKTSQEVYSDDQSNQPVHDQSNQSNHEQSQDHQ